MPLGILGSFKHFWLASIRASQKLADILVPIKGHQQVANLVGKESYLNAWRVKFLSGGAD